MAIYFLTSISSAKLTKPKLQNFLSNELMNKPSKKLWLSMIICLGLSTLTACKTTQNQPITITPNGASFPTELPKNTTKKNPNNYSPNSPTPYQKPNNQAYQLIHPSSPKLPIMPNPNASKPTTATKKKPTYIPLTKKPQIPKQVPKKDKKYIVSEFPAPAPMIDPTEAILAAARQNSHINRNTNKNNTNIKSSSHNKTEVPAFKKLMDTGIKNLNNNHLNDAEVSFSHAQRLMPKSSSVYFYLAQVALKKKQPRKAESMARRGLVISDSASRKRSFWQLIKTAGQMQGNKKTITEAEKALQ